MKDKPNFLKARDFMIEQNKVFDELGRGDEKKYTDGQIANFVGDGTDWMDEEVTWRQLFRLTNVTSERAGMTVDLPLRTFFCGFRSSPSPSAVR